MVLVWQIMDDLPDLPNFPAAKRSYYMVIGKCIVNIDYIVLLWRLVNQASLSYIEVNHSKTWLLVGKGVNICIYSTG